MPLPEEYVGVPANDLSMRIGRSIISLDDNPIYVYAVRQQSSRRSTIYYLRQNDLSQQSVEDNNDGLSVHNISSRFSLMTEPRGLVRFSRVPRRQFNQGVNNNNTAVGMYRVDENSNEVHLFGINQRLVNSGTHFHGVMESLNSNGSRYISRKVAEVSGETGVSQNMLYLFFALLRVLL